MKHAPNVGDRVVITRSQLPYLVGVKATVIDASVARNCCRLHLDSPVSPGDSNTQSDWERNILYDFIEVIEESANANMDIKFSFDSLIGEQHE